MEHVLPGKYEGAGTMVLFRIRSFETDMNSRVPIGFVEMDIRDFTRTSSFSVNHYHETVHYWFLEETNLLALNAFIGNGYCKLVNKAITNVDGTINLDANGEPLVVPDTVSDPLHSECGYIVVFTN